MIISAVDRHEKKNPKDYYIYTIDIEGRTLENEQGAPLFLKRSEIEEYGLIPLKTLTFPDISSLRNMIYEKRGKSIGMRALSKRSLTEKELANKLKENEIPGPIIDYICTLYKKAGLINDEVFAENFVSYRGKAKSKREITMKMKSKGIDGDLIDSALEAAGHDEYLIVLQHVRKVLPKVFRGEEDVRSMEKKEIDKIIGYLFRKGFRLDLIKNAIREVFQELKENEE